MVISPRSFVKFLKRRWLSLLLGAACIVLLWSVAVGTARLYRGGDFHAQSRHSRAAGPFLPADIQQADIQPWMTFDYLNHVLNIPPDYLKQALDINDAAYPKLQIGRYADRQHLDSATFIVSVRQALSNYGAE